ncbi:MAG: ORF6N domain-containing protein [Bacteriovorax sp.]|jgi:hypothetical protein
MINTESKIVAIENMIYTIRGQKVMLDTDLAKLYGVETKALNQAVKRNLDRFPNDFMFQINEMENDILRSQFVTAKLDPKRRFYPFVFTENGVAMLSTVLNSKAAIQVNISIMRIFTKLRSFHALESNLTSEVRDLKENTNKIFKSVFERLDSIEEDLVPKLPSTRKKIGIKSD